MLNSSIHQKNQNPTNPQSQKRKTKLKNEDNSSELKELIGVLKEIKNEIKVLSETINKVIEPPVALDHYTKGAAIRIDDSSSRINNPTF